MLTKEQIRNRTKTVTRRLGWKNLKPGELFWAVEKAQGLKKGEKVKRITLLRCLRNDSVTLNGKTMTKADCRREGFPEMSPREFVAMFTKNMGCKPSDSVQRIVFSYAEDSEVAE
ncbi:hypothetical protein NA78x_001767 [Anatilimnocola sp. NA78]|uniref:hypothetical protein n=1 Tax=Anatilimnocola sp. NA78 TaxID=3415683 RepID=UPI003CE51D91